MPLMSSPIDGSPMREVERYGVKMDICPTSGGIWLDKGELEKIFMMIRKEALEEAPRYAAPPPPPPTQTRAPQPTYRQDDYDDYDDDDYRRGRRPKRRKRESSLEHLMDIFD